MKSQLSESGLRISLRFLDQKLCSIEVQSGHCYSPLEGCIIFEPKSMIWCPNSMNSAKKRDFGRQYVKNRIFSKVQNPHFWSNIVFK